MSANRIYGHCPSYGYQLHWIVGGGSGCDRRGGAWKRGRQYSSCLCFIKSLPERKKAWTSEKKSRLPANITLSVPLLSAAPVPPAAKAAQSAPAHFGAAFLRHTRASRHPPAQTHRHPGSRQAAHPKKGAGFPNPLENGKAEVQNLYEPLQATISSMELPKNFENKKLPNTLR